jgi:hypothetical protein
MAKNGKLYITLYITSCRASKRRAVQELIQAQTFDPARDASLYVIDIRPHSGLLMDVMALKE